jgi:hypothetical protein
MSMPSLSLPSSPVTGLAPNRRATRSGGGRRVTGLAMAGALLMAVSACTGASTPAPSSGALPVSLKSLDKEVAVGKTANISVDTKAGATCTITVTYSTGPATDPGLQPAVAASNGLAAWGWTVAQGTAPGTYPIDVVCTSGLLKGELKEQFTVK